jgi:lysozyme
VSFAYNVGVGALGSSTLLKKHNAGDYEAAQKEFLKWNKAAGKELSGLTKRRLHESALYGS